MRTHTFQLFNSAHQWITVDLDQIITVSAIPKDGYCENCKIRLVTGQELHVRGDITEILNLWHGPPPVEEPPKSAAADVVEDLSKARSMVDQLMVDIRALFKHPALSTSQPPAPDWYTNPPPLDGFSSATIRTAALRKARLFELTLLELELGKAPSVHSLKDYIRTRRAEIERGE
jgi:hypothetical protein